MIENLSYWATICEKGQFYAMLKVKGKYFETAFISSEEPVKVDVEPIMEAWGQNHTFILKSKTGKYYTFNCFSGELVMNFDSTTVEMVNVSNGSLCWYNDGLLFLGNANIECDICPRYVCYSDGVWLFDYGDQIKSYRDGKIRNMGKNYPIKPFKKFCLSINKSTCSSDELFSVLYQDGDVWCGENMSDGEQVFFNEWDEKIIDIFPIHEATHYYVSGLCVIYSKSINSTCGQFLCIDVPITKVLNGNGMDITYVTGCDIMVMDFSSEFSEIKYSFDCPIVSVIYGDVIIVHLIDNSVHRVELDNVVRIPFFDENPIAMPSKASVKNARKVC